MFNSLRSSTNQELFEKHLWKYWRLNVKEANTCNSLIWRHHVGRAGQAGWLAGIPAFCTFTKLKFLLPVFLLLSTIMTTESTCSGICKRKNDVRHSNGSECMPRCALKVSWPLCFVFSYCMLEPLHKAKNSEYSWCRKPYHAITNWHLALSTNRTGTQRRSKVCPWHVYCMYCSWRNGTSQNEAILNSKKVKPVVLSIVKSYLHQLHSYSEENSVK